MSITAKECIKRIDEALYEFGRYSYYDKGADEVMDIPDVVLELKGMTKDEILSVLTEVSKYEHAKPFLCAVLTEVSKYEHAKPFLCAVIGSLDDWKNPMAEELFESELFQKYY